MRGKVSNSHFLFLRDRITPAYAGKSKHQGKKSSDDEDHPRLCGEKGTLKKKPCKSIGSPPPMRGKAAPRQPCLLAKGITPAYAGKSARGGRSLRSLRDHPRLCGEKLRVHILFIMGVRITPAYAGKSSVYSDSAGLIWDHPRLCGEKLSDFSIIANVLGSPPPMRGKGAGNISA